MADEHQQAHEPFARKTAPIVWAVEHVSPTDQQRERIADGLHLVFELVARRYQRMLRERDVTEGGQNGLD